MLFATGAPCTCICFQGAHVDSFFMHSWQTWLLDSCPGIRRLTCLFTFADVSNILDSVSWHSEGLVSMYAYILRMLLGTGDPGTCFFYKVACGFLFSYTPGKPISWNHVLVFDGSRVYLRSRMFPAFRMVCPGVLGLSFFICALIYFQNDLV